VTLGSGELPTRLVLEAGLNPPSTVRIADVGVSAVGVVTPTPNGNMPNAAIPPGT
jgi:hypothetical protein